MCVFFLPCNNSFPCVTNFREGFCKGKPGNYFVKQYNKLYEIYMCTVNLKFAGTSRRVMCVCMMHAMQYRLVDSDLVVG